MQNQSNAREKKYVLSLVLKDVTDSADLMPYGKELNTLTAQWLKAFSVFT